MEPKDFPTERLNAAYHVLKDFACEEHDRARKADAIPSRIGAYEAALAYGRAAHIVREAIIDTISELDRRAAQLAAVGNPETEHTA